MRLLIAGASGMVGSETVRLAAENPDITRVTAILRAAKDFGPAVETVIHHDFLNFDALKNVFAGHDACIWCLGISQSRVNAEGYFTITHDYAVAAAKAMLEANPSIAFTFLSAMGADSSGKTRIRFSHVKGQTENTLKTLGFKHLFIFRPGAILANPKFVQSGTYKKVERAMMRLFSFVFPQLSIGVTDLARLMIEVTSEKGDKMTYSQPDILNSARKKGMATHDGHTKSFR